MKDYFKGVTAPEELYKVSIDISDEIPEEMPKYTRNDMFFSLSGDYDFLGTLKEQILREAYVQHGMFGFVSWKWVTPLAEWIGNKKCLEVMAGRGWLSYALRRKEIDVIATDNFSWHENGSYPRWKDPVTPIEKIDAIGAVEKYGKEVDILIMCWAYMDNTAYDVIKKLHEINSKAVTVFIGEGPGGCTANDNFYRNFKEIEDPKFELAASQYQQWWGLHDRLLLGKYANE